MFVMSSKIKTISSDYSSQKADNTTKNDGRRRIDDGSSSTETLSAEEQHTLNHTQRQEPQGEEQTYAYSVSSITVPSSIMNTPTSHLARSSNPETHSPSSSISRNNDSNLSMSSNTNTLIIHHSVPDESWSHRWLSGYTPSTTKSMRERSLQPSGSESAPFVTRVNTKLSDTLTSSSSFVGGGTLLSSSLLDSSASLTAAGMVKNSVFRVTSPHLARPSPSKYSASTEILDIPSSYLDQSEVLKHLIHHEGKDSPVLNGGNNGYGGGSSDQSASSSNSTINVLHAERGSLSGSSSQGSHPIGPASDEAEISALLHHRLHPHPPPAYPAAWQLECGGDLKETTADSRSDKPLLSKSQPDLTRVGTLKESTPSREVLGTRYSSALQEDEVPLTLRELVDILTHENSALKLEVDINHRKVSKLQRFELEMAKVEEQYEALVKMNERREQLERLARLKLHSEVRRLTEQNAELKDQLDGGGGTPVGDVGVETASLKRELNQRDVIIAQVVSQNKELIATKERQEMELTAQRQTLNEQRTHIDILDSALTNAQTNVVKLEEEVRKKQNLVDQSGQLKRLLLSMKLASDRREQSEKNLRQKLEMEILQLRSNAKMDSSANEAAELRRELREKDEKIMILEGEVTKCEQRFLQESAMRQIAIEAASMPKDAKIAALEKNSHDSERRIAQAKSDKVRHLDEMHNMSKKIAALESRNRSLESHNAEREALILALQRRAEEKETLLQSSPSGSVGGTNKMKIPRLAEPYRAPQAPPQHQYKRGASPQAFPSTPRKDEELGSANVPFHPLFYPHPPYQPTAFESSNPMTSYDPPPKPMTSYDPPPKPMTPYDPPPKPMTPYDPSPKPVTSFDPPPTSNAPPPAGSHSIRELLLLCELV